MHSLTIHLEGHVDLRTFAACKQRNSTVGCSFEGRNQSPCQYEKEYSTDPIFRRLPQEHFDLREEDNVCHVCAIICLNLNVNQNMLTSSQGLPASTCEFNPKQSLHTLTYEANLQAQQSSLSFMPVFAFPRKSERKPVCNCLRNIECPPWRDFCRRQ